MSTSPQDWYRDAKLGIMINWGPYSVPGWAPTEHGGIDSVLRAHDWSFYFENNPDSAWYANGLRLRESATRAYHLKHFGKHVAYERLAKRFKTETESFDPTDWVDLFSEMGARYVVMSAKHCDGFLLWPSEQKPSPSFAAVTDVLGKVAEAARAKKMRFGLSYSGLLDWTTQSEPIADYADMLLVETGDEFSAYVEGHYRELIDRYRPDILWNLVGIPAQLSKKKLHTFYRDLVPHGLVNDRWRQTGALGHKALSTSALKQKAGEKARESILDGKAMGSDGDFSTHTSFGPTTSQGKPWEMVCPLGYSYGFNRAEQPEHYLRSDDLVRRLIDVVSKNGNLLVSVGPEPDGTLPYEQRHRLAQLGAWLAIHGEAIFGTRPWKRAEGATSEGVPLRFTTRNNALYVIFLETPPMLRIGISDLRLEDVPRPKLPKGQEDEIRVSLLGSEREIEWSGIDRHFTANIPGSFRPTGPSVLKIAWVPVDAPKSNFYNDII
ncbi:MAG: alpha-L-fucosidase [Spirochaetales bacterium]